MGAVALALVLAELAATARPAAAPDPLGVRPPREPILDVLWFRRGRPELTPIGLRGDPSEADIQRAFDACLGPWLQALTAGHR